jgi:hypothetical protein
VRKCLRCGLVNPDRSVRCECGFLLAWDALRLQEALRLLQLSRSELAETIREAILENPILDDALDTAVRN